MVYDNVERWRCCQLLSRDCIVYKVYIEFRMALKFIVFLTFYKN